MVSLRCKNHVRNELKVIGIPILKIGPGIVQLENKLSEADAIELNKRLLTLGMEILSAKQSVSMDYLLDEVEKNIYSNQPIPTNEFVLKLLSKKEYKESSSLFSEVKGIELTEYMRIQQIERVKGMLIYDDYTIKQISEIVNFNNPGQLSRLFKKITGLTPSYYKTLKKGRIKTALNNSMQT